MDCWRIYPEGMKCLYENAGLTVELCKVEALEIDLSKTLSPYECNLFPGRSPMRLINIFTKRLLGQRVAVPGASHVQRWSWLRSTLGFPATFAVDMVTVGYK